MWGSTETNVENWKAVKPLRNHDSGQSISPYLATLATRSACPATISTPIGPPEPNLDSGWYTYPSSIVMLADVAGVAWSPGDEYLASVGLDSTVYIYEAQNFSKSPPFSHHTTP